MKNIVIFASGSGTNAETICKYFENHSKIKVCGIFTNKDLAGVIEVAKKYNISHFVFDKKVWNDNFLISNYLDIKIDLIVLAGFLWKVPESFINNHCKIINIHPSLLPKFGGKGMYGIKVHESVKNSGDNETGITIHEVNSNYDEGNILFQSKCNLTSEDDVESIRKKVQVLEHLHLPKFIESLLSK